MFIFCVYLQSCFGQIYPCLSEYVTVTLYLIENPTIYLIPEYIWTALFF